MMVSIARPIGPVVLMPAVTLRKCTPLCYRSAMRASRFRVLRPSRSSFQTATSSPPQRCSSILFSSGRLALVPLTLWSVKIRRPPAACNAECCRSVFWSTVLTLAVTDTPNADTPCAHQSPGSLLLRMAHVGQIVRTRRRLVRLREHLASTRSRGSPTRLDRGSFAGTTGPIGGTMTIDRLLSPIPGNRTGRC